jgi:hypothetical protein
MVGKSRRAVLDAFECGHPFMFLYMFLLVLGVCAAQQHELESTKSMPVSSSRSSEHRFVRGILHACRCRFFPQGSLQLLDYETHSRP